MTTTPAITSDTHRRTSRAFGVSDGPIDAGSGFFLPSPPTIRGEGLMVRRSTTSDRSSYPRAAATTSHTLATTTTPTQPATVTLASATQPPSVPSRTPDR